MECPSGRSSWRSDTTIAPSSPTPGGPIGSSQADGEPANGTRELGQPFSPDAHFHQEIDMTDMCGNWVETFPGNLRWSNAMQIVKGMVPWAAAAMGEIDIVVERLRARVHEGEPDRAWKGEGGVVGDKAAAIADAAAAERGEITAGNNYMRAGNYYYSAERFIPPGADKMAMYEQALRCYRAALERLHTNVEFV